MIGTHYTCAYLDNDGDTETEVTLHYWADCDVLHGELEVCAEIEGATVEAFGRQYTVDVDEACEASGVTLDDVVWDAMCVARDRFECMRELGSEWQRDERLGY